MSRFESGRAESLGLDPGLLERTASAHEGYARVLLSELGGDSVGEQGMLAASCFMIAASHWALIDARHAHGVFRTAAEHYAAQGSPFYAVLAACGMHEPLLRRAAEAAVHHQENLTGAASDEGVVLHDLFALTMSSAMFPDEYRWSTATRGLLERQSAHFYDQTGRAALPWHAYHGVAAAVTAAVREPNDGARTVRSALADYLRRMDDAIGRAASDRYHWRNLRASLLPVEPEAIAVCMTSEAVSQTLWSSSATDLVNEIDLPRRQRLPMDIAEEIWSAGQTGNQVHGTSP
jgi:hypothetical protein